MTLPTGVPGPTTVRRLVGVYNADGTVLGELSYFVGARLGRAHCSLCDITHGTFREKADWRAGRNGPPVPFDTFHRDDQPDHVRTAAADTAPVVVAETDDGVTVLLGPDALSACDGSVTALLAAVDSAVTEAGLVWPTVT